MAGRALTKANWKLLGIAFSRPPLSDSLSARRTFVARSEWLFICKVVEAVYAAKAPKRHIWAQKASNTYTVRFSDRILEAAAPIEHR